ncbi:MAG: DUF309 domain-containing protein [Gemmataceae bacterium]|nr:DUF309 domain-containing protein [Gemmata sp.]MDW8197951.1 DUF309 domain-containing protein [Gemmataceae bacterium]
MADAAEIPDPRFLEGIERFNQGEYFEAHEVWEDLWQDSPSADRRFYQALIQAAVAIYHHQRGNNTGAQRLLQSGRRYMQPYAPVYHGLAVEAFWEAVAAYLAGWGTAPQIAITSNIPKT